DAKEEHLFFEYDDFKDKIKLQYVGSLSFDKRLYVHKTTGEQFIKELSPIIDTGYIYAVFDENDEIYYISVPIIEPVYPALLLESPYEDSGGKIVSNFMVVYTNSQPENSHGSLYGAFIRMFSPSSDDPLTYHGVLALP
ncbi:MAG: hypothetical protein ACRCY4_02545, partial [Brevinema sp.]